MTTPMTSWDLERLVLSTLGNDTRVLFEARYDRSRNGVYEFTFCLTLERNVYLGRFAGATIEEVADKFRRHWQRNHESRTAAAANQLDSVIIQEREWREAVEESNA